MKELELLSPAKNSDYGIAAINCGADAVYIGAKQFGARAAAGNSLADIEKLINYAHKYHAKVYIALNTLLFDNELNQAQKLATDVYNMGADALIIQDMAFLEMNLPPIQLFASTQTNNTTWQKVKFLERVGFNRVILARELSIAEITEIRANTTVELESFVHGSICVCYSGQCYLSAALLGKSGNRGECQQPCRWQYKLVNAAGNEIIKNKHLISPKDLNLSLQLPQLINAGITSFKIEGRLKDLAYLKNITALYRQQINKFLINNPGQYIKASDGNCTIPWQPNENNTFNRGYTNYFINNRQANIAQFNTPKSVGKTIGTVIKINHNSLQINTNEIINNGDGLCYFNQHGTLEGFRVNTASNNTLYPAEMPNIKSGIELYRNHDQHFEKTLNQNLETRKINLQLTFSETTTGFALHAIDEYCIEVHNSTIINKTVANNSQNANQNIINQLSKTGNTIYNITNVELKISAAFFIPTSVLNELRRKTLELHESKRLLLHKRIEKLIQPNNYPYPEKILSYKGNVLNKQARNFYLRHGVETIDTGFELSANHHNKQLMTLRYCLKYELVLCHKHPNYNKKTQLTEQLFLQWGKGKLKVEFDCKNCEMIILKDI